jgi:hypothetical protein
MSSKNFQLEHALDNYIDLVNKDASLTPSDEQELRTHVIDATEELQKTGLTNEEAFFIAAKRTGRAEIIAEEYKKVNNSFQPGNIWAYMLLGFSIITTVLWVYDMASQLLGTYLKQHFSSRSPEMPAIIIIFNLLICTGIWSVLKWGASFSTWVHRIIQKKPWFTILIVSIVPACVFILRLPLSQRNGSINFLYPDLYYALSNNLVALSYYFVLMSAGMIVLLSVFSIAHPGKVSFKSLFEKPSVIFLLLYGCSTEMLAAMCRVISEHVFFSALLFGIVYAVGTFLVCYYNSSKRFFYVATFSLFGLIAETWGGISADIDRGGTIFTVYFVTALIAGVLIGSFAGIKVKEAFTYKEELQ